jgi:hypothetical protein
MKYRRWVEERLKERRDKAREIMCEAKEDVAWRAHTVGKWGDFDAADMAIFKNFVSKNNLREITFDAWYKWEV